MVPPSKNKSLEWSSDVIIIDLNKNKNKNKKVYLFLGY